MKLCVTGLAVVLLVFYFHVSAERAAAQRVDERARRSADAIIATEGTSRERAAFFAREPRPAGIPAWLAGLAILAAGWLAVQALFFLRQWR